MTTISFREKDEILTLWVEKTVDDGYVVGWCPELQNTMIVHPENIVSESPKVLSGE